MMYLCTKNKRNMATTVNIPIVPPGTDMKFRIAVVKEGFSLAENDFYIVIKNRWGRVVARVQKSDCYIDNEWRWYFNVENAPEGEHYAVFVGVYDDGDYGKQHRVWNDRQLLFIGRDGSYTVKQDTTDSPVSYEQVWIANVGDDEYLADSEGNLVYGSDGQRISFQGRQTVDGKVKMQMTGDEFLQLIEGRNPDGKIDTLSELMDAARGISDSETIKEEIDAAVEGKQDTLTFASDNTCETIVDDLD